MEDCPAAGRRAVSRLPPDLSPYDTEKQLVVDVLELLRGVFDVQGMTTEFDYNRGRTDVVALVGSAVVAIEAKLTRWRGALHQAYRNRCFAHRSYVALPHRTALLAMRYEQEFRDRDVGLLAVTPEGIEVLLDPATADPLEGWLTDAAAARVSTAAAN